MNVRHVLIPYKGTSEEQELLKTICAVCRSFRARLSVVHVLEVPMTLPLETDLLPGVDEANAILDQAEDISRSAGVKATTDLLQARDAGHAIVEEAMERGADLIVMEAHRQAHAGMLELGRTVDHVMKHAPCAVWISRLPAASEGL